MKDGGGLAGTPLMCALAEGHLDVAKLLIATGADQSASGSSGLTAKSIIQERLAAYQSILRIMDTSKPQQMEMKIDEAKAGK